MVDAGPGGDCAGGGDSAGGGAGGLWMQRWASTLSIVSRGRGRTHVARMASSRRSTLSWLAGVEAGLCALPAATTIGHKQLLTDKVEERTLPVVGETEAPRRGAPFFLSELFFCLYLRNG